MKVALDAGPLLDPPTGIGRYTAELAAHLELAGHEVKGFAFALRGNVPASPPTRRLRLPATLARSLWMRFGAPGLSRLVGDADVVHGTNFVLPPTGDVPGVVTVHDLSFTRPDVFPGGERLVPLVPWSIGRAARVIVPSAAVGAEVSEAYGVEVDRISVTHEGVSPLFFGATPLSSVALGRFGIPGPFVLSLGTIEPRKNLPALLAAWAGARALLPGWTLAIAGPKGWGPELEPAPGVVLLGRVPDETLPGLLAAADVFCYPSRYEGFGLPPLEAMAAGTAALVGDYPAASEVVGDAALRVDPYDVDDIGEGLVSLATDGALRRRLELAGRARAARFTWSATARATTEAYEAAISS